jgi:BlaI family transcriptional regulator, penicillinase repressor
MKPLPRISEAEWEVMKIVWSRRSASAEEITTTLGWHPKTVRTYLNRLVKKGALGFTKTGRAYLYRPLVKESDCIAAASDSFLDRVFGGSLAPMVAQLVERQRLSTTEIDELKKVLKKAKEK